MFLQKRSDRRPSPGGSLRVVVAALLVSVLMMPGNAYAADERLEKAQQRLEELQAELNELLNTIGELEAEHSAITDEIEQLEGRVENQQAQADEASRRVAERYKQSFMTTAATSPALGFFGGDNAREATERARVLEVLARNGEEDREMAVSASMETQALGALLEESQTELAEREDELEAQREAAEEKVAEANERVEEVKRKIAEEEAERRRREEEQRRREEEQRRREEEERQRREEEAAAEREAAAQEEEAAAAEREAAAQEEEAAANQDSSSSNESSTSTASVSGGVACPVGTPREYSDTYGAPRSGGRSHMGVDILSPMGTPIYAYEDGAVRLSSNSLGGISLHLTGDSGNEYYYAHLSGYVSGLSTGQRVEVGEQIGYNGDTGNASGIPHLHFEVFPGGGSNVNPTPYADRACQ